VFWIGFQILIAWLLADWLTGFVHWFEDKYLDGGSRLGFVDRLSQENDLHHRKPTAMLMNSGWTNMRSAAAVGWPFAGLMFLAGAPLWLWLVPFLASFGNLVHRWAHTPSTKLPRWIRGLQEFGIFTSPEQHDLHHRSMQRLIPKHLAGYKFCPMTDWVNPILDGLGFWTRLERSLTFVGLQTTNAKLEQLRNAQG
jgi:ubiquitin-conjugating enzyme E2 variant